MKEIQTIKENYEMGFITPHEFLTQIEEILFQVGAGRDLTDAMNLALQPLASFVHDEILNAPAENKKQIKDFKLGE